MNELLRDVERLLERQAAEWPSAHEGIASLRQVRTKTVTVDEHPFRVQFNPRRAVSSLARTDASTVARRPCFLCATNRESRQESVPWNDYEILVNPFPVLDNHLTVASVRHVPQSLAGRLHDMVKLVGDLTGYAVTYNGARCGASAPDHLHFQAVPSHLLPFLYHPKLTCIINTTTRPYRTTLDSPMAKAVLFGGPSPEQVAETGESLLRQWQERTKENTEPLLNAIVWNTGEIFAAAFFPRTAHRPACYYADGPEQILFSPAVLEMAGIAVTVREEDYDRMDENLIRRLYRDVIPDRTEWEEIKNEVKRWSDKNPI